MASSEKAEARSGNAIAQLLKFAGPRRCFAYAGSALAALNGVLTIVPLVLVWFVLRDFVAVGDVSVKVIGADGPVLDAAVPVRQLLEQLVAKTGLPPFLLGLSWSSTERMSAQQADLLTSELWALRRAVEPVLLRICTLWLRLHGCGCAPEIVWDDISLQDLVEEAQADLYRARTEQLRKGT